MGDHAAFLLCLAALPLAAWIGAIVAARPGAARLRALCATHESTLRLLRLAASDQRNIALTLFGHAQHAPDPALTGIARRLFDMSETLVSQTESPNHPRRLTEEAIEVMPVVEFAVAQIASHLGPSRRAWRIEANLAEIRLWADRRALNQVLVNVLSGAAATTRNGDWIELCAEQGAEEWAILVQDEGIGLPVAQTDGRPMESRGLGLQLALARSLMQAHGGSLTVESTERVGTRVRLSFPGGRVLPK
jgi:signal transduction histidine kinase